MELPPGSLRTVEAQMGVFARRQLCAWVMPHLADDLLRGPWCERMERGVYRIVGGARLPEQVAIAATLRCGPGATLTGPAALRLMEVDGCRGDDPFLILLPSGKRVVEPGFRVRRDPDPGRAVSRRGEVRVAGPVDALIDSAEFVDTLGARRLRLAHDVLRWRGQLRPGQLLERLTGLGAKAPGGGALAELLELDRTKATGEGERRLGKLLARFDPPPEPQVWVTPRRSVDWYFHGVRYGYEYQGTVDHATLAGRLADDARDTELRRDGIRLGYLADADLADEAALLATVAGALAIRAHELGVDPPILRPA